MIINRTTYILYNPLSNNKSGGSAVEDVQDLLDEKNIEVKDLTTISDMKEFIGGLSKNDQLIVAGGDGTLNHFVNDLGDVKVKQKILYFASGSGNDFYNDVKDKVELENGMVPLNDFIKKLPEVTVHGITKKFINGIGYGIDGYCCEEGDRIRATSSRPVNYTKIAIKGLLGAYKPRCAKVTVDGNESSFKRVWLAPAMVGRFYGGGMMVAPEQDRLNKKHTVSCVVWHDIGALGTITKLPTVFKGTHLKFKKNICVITGHEVVVEFDRPCALQVDGETYLNVSRYSVKFS